MATQADGINTTPEETQDRVVSKRAITKGKKAIEKNFKTLEKLEVTWLPPDKLTPNDWNPNRQDDHDFELLLSSMEEDGFTQPVLALTATSNGKHIIVDGEHRWRAGMVLKYPEIPVVLSSMTPEQAKIATIRHNRARGSHDIELEAAILRDLQQVGALDWAKDSLLLDDAELNRLLNDVQAPEIMADEEFSEAWVPDNFTDDERELLMNNTLTTKANVVQDDSGEDRVMYAMTEDAIEQQRKREDLITRAKNEQERKAAVKDTQVYRLSLIFSGEEAVTVKKALGDKPAEKLLALCASSLEEKAS